MRLDTIRVAPSGTAILVQSDQGESIEIDSSSLRVLVDPNYAALMRARFLALRGPLDELGKAVGQ
jgi:hypothetical protein